MTERSNTDRRIDLESQLLDAWKDRTWRTESTWSLLAEVASEVVLGDPNRATEKIIVDKHDLLWLVRELVTLTGAAMPDRLARIHQTYGLDLTVRESSNPLCAHIYVFGEKKPSGYSVGNRCLVARSEHPHLEKRFKAPFHRFEGEPT